ncbi:hypothetical protein OEA41_002014 [Lepraria neglecta]|uniref:Uncharacterized protein n=1 Tax=Lepraria neglecta TaxID=209136 RepID=A0AAE0DPJ2_9LECA|nr:hypothetical protein OEA41_002014 [Lepraria neglecta]
MDEYSEFFDFNLDFSDSVDMSFFGKTEEKDKWDYTIPQCPSMTKSKSMDQINFLPHDPPIQLDSARDEFLYQSPSTLDMNLLDDSMMVDDSTPSEMAHILEDTRMLFPSPCPNTSQQDNPMPERRRRLSVSKSLSTLRTGILDFGTSQTDELKQTQSMLQLQIEIYDCSATIIHSDTTFEIDNQGCQNQSGALGKLFCATEKFIKLISDTCSPQHPTTPQASTLISPMSARSAGSSNTTMAVEKRPSLKRGASSPALDGSFGSFMFDAMPSSKCDAAFSSTAAFHLMMACHTRLLTAYDTIINSIGAQLSDASNSGRRPSTASLSIGAFTIESGTSLESRLHLQVISHQLSNLSDALRRALLSSRSHRQAEDFSSRATMRSLYQARRPATPPTLEESAMELVEEQEMILQMKIKKIKNMSSEPQNSRRTRSRMDN